MMSAIILVASVMCVYNVGGYLVHKHNKIVNEELNRCERIQRIGDINSYNIANNDEPSTKKSICVLFGFVLGTAFKITMFMLGVTIGVLVKIIVVLLSAIAKLFK